MDEDDGRASGCAATVKVSTPSSETWPRSAQGRPPSWVARLLSPYTLDMGLAGIDVQWPVIPA